jgi:5'(3')-deoxyribonucleotidase
MPEERRFLCDVDNVVADFTGGVIKASGTSKKREDFNVWDVRKVLSKEEWKRAEEAMGHPGFFLNLELVDGAKNKVRELKARGLEFIWVTAPWEGCTEWDSARRFWIRENFGSDDAVIITKDKEHIEGDIFLDDKPENVEKWLKAHKDKQAFIYDAPYNQGYDLVPRVTWKTIEWFI